MGKKKARSEDEVVTRDLSTGGDGETDLGDDASPVDPELARAMDAARRSPADPGAWDRLEDLSAALQRPDEVAEVYREVLEADLPKAQATAVGRRATRFLEEWFGEESPALEGILGRVLELDPSAEWAFQRLSVVFTVAARWDDLLKLYDSAIAAATDRERRGSLLDEAANVAKDFAQLPDRAIGYLEVLLELRPGDGHVVASLERLLERQGRWQDLADFWARDLAALPPEERLAVRLRVATTLLDRLDRPAAALEQLEAAVAEGRSNEDVTRTLERITEIDSAPPETRRAALLLLKRRYEAENRATDVVRTLDTALALAGRDESVALHREAGQRLLAQERFEQAMEHFAMLLALEPQAVDARRELQALASRTGRHAELAEAFETAAGATEDPAARASLRLEAAEVRRHVLGDPDAAATLYRAVLEEPGIPEARALSACRHLAALLEEAGRKEDLLDVLVMLAEREPEDRERTAVLGRAARLAESLERPNRALSLWRRRLELDGTDIEALDASVAALERLEQWEALAETLRKRAAAPLSESQRRSDLVRVADLLAEQLDDLPGAVDTWRHVEETFGEDQESVDTLSVLLDRAGRFDELHELLESAAVREAGHVADVLVRLGDAKASAGKDQDQGVGHYVRALRIRPEHEGGISALRELLESPDHGFEAAEALASAFSVITAWGEVVALVEHRLAGADNDEHRIRLLVETADIQERRLEDPAAALRTMRRALALAPSWESIEADLLRLAELCEGWREAAEALGAAAEATSERARRLHLHATAARLHEARLDDASAAAEQWGAAAALEPERLDLAEALVRCAGRAGRWDRVAVSVVALVGARREVPSSLVEAIEAEAEASSGWAALTSALDGALGAAESIDSLLGRELDRLVARWLEERAGDASAAADALRRAAGRGGDDAETLRALARLQRRSPGRELVDTLLKLADWAAVEDDLDPLSEAVRVAQEHLDEPALVRLALERLYRESTRLWRRGSPARGDTRPEDGARQALDGLVDLYDEEGAHEKAFNLLVDAARLPFDIEQSLGLRRRAASLASGPLADRTRAVMVFRSILEDAPDDADAVRGLARIYEAEGRAEELLPLLHHELSLCQDVERRLQLRLDIARTVQRIEVRGGRLEALQANLEERPGHAESVKALIEMLDEAERHGDLADLLSLQARRLEEAEESARAADLWGRVARLAEDRLGDLERALHAHRRVLELDSSTDSLSALARLHTDRGEHSAAARWLERLLKSTAGAERRSVAHDLARARLAAGQEGLAVECLEAALHEAPEAFELRAMLGDLYRRTDALEPLARLLTESAPHLSDPQDLRRSALEAAEIYGRIGLSDRSIEVLERASSALPGDREIKRMLATGLLAAERVDEARGILETLIADFGRRRNAERAAVHLQLARVLRAEGNLDGALEELDRASGMDVRNAQVMSMLGQLAREAGQLDRAERAFRALLMVVRRQSSEDVAEAGPSEVLYELHHIAGARGHQDQAGELLMSALQTASGSSVEMRRFERAMASRSRPDIALRAVEMRIAALESGPELAEAHAERAELLDTALDRPEDAFEARLRVLEEQPDRWDNVRTARQLARRLDSTGRLVDTLKELITGARRQEDKALAGALLLRLGEVYEQDAELLDPAAESFARAEELLDDRVPARRALIRIAGVRGDVAEERRLLELLVADESAPSEARIESRYRLAELLLTATTTGDEGLAVLEQALGEDPMYDRAGEILRRATDGPRSGPARLVLYGRVARASEDQALMLDFLVKRAPTAEATLEDVQEAVRLAELLGEEERAEPLLVRAAEIASSSPGGLAAAPWVATGLAARRRAQGDLAGAVEWMERAAEAANDEAESRRLWGEAADLAAEGGDREAAARVYERLLEKDRADRAVWEPLLDLLCEIGDSDRISAHVISTLETLTEVADRSAVRLRHAGFLLGLEGREPDAVDVLKALLVDDPSNREANALLADTFERIGFDEDLTELLRQQLDAACGGGDAETVRELALRLGGQLEKLAREEAMDVYRRGLGILPNDRELADRLLALFGPDDDPRERVALMERPLPQEEGEAAARLALELADEWAALEDYDGVRRVLRIGHELCPANTEVRRRLEEGYNEHEEWEPLAALLLAEAERSDDTEGSVELLRRTAAVHRERRRDPASAAEALVKARQLRPEDTALLEELARIRAEALDHATAIEEVGAALASHGEGEASQADLFALRAELRMATGDDAGAVADLESAYAIAGPEVASRLAGGLDRHRLELRGRGDRERERTATLRLVDVLRDQGEGPRAREILADWLAQAGGDREALYLLRDLEEAEGQWDRVAASCERLLDVEEGSAQVSVAMHLADAYEKLNTPDAARAGLERVHRDQPDVGVVRDRLGDLYEKLGATRELASLAMAEARTTGSEEGRFALLRRAGDLYLQSDGATHLAIEPLEEAVRIKPDDHETTVLLVDAYIESGRHAEAVSLLEQAIGARGSRRTPQLAELQHRMARLAEAAGDREVQLQWLSVALDSDRRNGFIAADLANLAMELADYESAMKAVRVVTVGRSESPMSRAEAFLIQARISQAKGEQGPALAWAKRALAEDPDYGEAQTFVKLLEG